MRPSWSSDEDTHERNAEVARMTRNATRTTRTTRNATQPTQPTQPTHKRVRIASAAKRATKFYVEHLKFVSSSADDRMVAVQIPTDKRVKGGKIRVVWELAD
jgi:hypothetical protein